MKRKTVLKRIISYLKPHKLQFTIAIIFSIISMIASIICPTFIGNTTDEIVKGISKKNEWNAFLEEMGPYQNFISNIETINMEAAKSLNENMTVKDAMTIELIPNNSTENFSENIKNIIENNSIFIYENITFEQVKTANDMANVVNEIHDKLDLKPITNEFGNTKLNQKTFINYREVNKILIITSLLIIATSITTYLVGFITSCINREITYKMRKQLNTKLNKLPLSYYDKTNNGEILSYTTNDIDIVSYALSMSLTDAICDIVLFIGILIMMLKISGILTLIVFATIPIFLVLLVIIIAKSSKHFKNNQDYLGHINGFIEESYSGHDIIKLYEKEEDQVKNLQRLNDVLYESAWKSNFLSGLMNPLMQFFANLSFVVTCIIGGYFTLQGRMTIGTTQAFITYARNFTNPLTNLANLVGSIEQVNAAATRIFTFLDAEEEPKELQEPLTKTLKGNIKFDHISFSYDKEKPVIQNFSANIKEGSKVAIVGPTGAGKTTIVKLLMRFYELDEGNIYIDNHNIKDIRKQDLRNLFGMVLQETWLHKGTIQENIAYAKEDASEKEIKNAAKNASCDYFIKMLPSGYDYKIEEETTNISEGEKQLLTIARVFLKNPEIIILDEATSKVDTRTEILIQQAMEKLMGNKTSFIIAHRLSTILNADLILVMNEGNIVEQGTHKELMKKKGFYYELYNSQYK